MNSNHVCFTMPAYLVIHVTRENISIMYNISSTIATFSRRC